MDLRKIRAVLFDLDGTLLDTLGDICASLNITMRRFGYPELTKETCRKLICTGVRMLIKGALPGSVSDEMLDEVLSAYQQIYTEHCADHSKPYPGAAAILRALTEGGYRVGLITNKVQENAEYLMRVNFPEMNFALIWGNNGVRPLKPSPDSGRQACRTLDLRPEEILFIGDGETDITFARNNGFTACGVTWGYRDPDILRRLGADMMIDSFDALADALGLPQ